MKLITLAEANHNYFKHCDFVASEADKLVDEINAAILAADENNTSRWAMGAMDTNRVVYIDVTEYLPEVVQKVIDGLTESHFAVQTMSIGTDDGVMKLLAVMWDLELSSLLLCTNAIFNVGGLDSYNDDDGDCCDEEAEAPAACNCLEDLVEMAASHADEEEEETTEGDDGITFGETPVESLSEEQALSGHPFDIPDEEQGGEEPA